MKRVTRFGYPVLREGDLILLTIALLRAVGLAKHFRITQEKATSPRMVHVLPLETSRVEGPPAALPILDFQGFSCKWWHTRHTPLTIQCLSQSQKSKDLPSPKRESLQIFHHLEAPQVACFLDIWQTGSTCPLGSNMVYQCLPSRYHALGSGPWARVFWQELSLVPDPLAGAEKVVKSPATQWDLKTSAHSRCETRRTCLISSTIFLPCFSSSSSSWASWNRNVRFERLCFDLKGFESAFISGHALRESSKICFSEFSA